MRVDPRTHLRGGETQSRSAPSAASSNAALIEAFSRAVDGKVVATTKANYLSHVRDAEAYARTLTGRAELAFREWKRETVWSYIHYVEANYCARFVIVNFARAPGVMCRARKWTGRMSPEEAVWRYPSNVG